MIRLKHLYTYLFTFFLIFNYPILGICQGEINRSIKINGVIVDSISNKPLVGTVVTLFLPSDTLHVITNIEGVYNFSTNKQPYFLEAAFLGYRVSRISTNQKSNIQIYDTIRMIQRSFEIDAAIVDSRIKKIVYRGDTIQFNAAAYKTLPGATVSSLVSKLPGVKIENGVWFMGELVSGAYVDGRNVFGSDVTGLTNLLENLDAKDIISIEAFKEISDHDKHLGNTNAPKRFVFNFITFSKLSEITIGHFLSSYGKQIDIEKGRYYRDKYGIGVTLNYFGEKKGNFQSNILHNNINKFTNKIDELSTLGANIPGDTKQTIVDIRGTITLGKNKTIEVQPSYSFEHKNSLNLIYSEQSFFPTSEYSSRMILDSTSRNEITNNHTIGFKINSKPRKHTIDIYTEFTFLNLTKNSSIINNNKIEGLTFSIFHNNATNREFGFLGQFDTNWKWKISPKLTFGTNISTKFSNNSQQEVRIDTTLLDNTKSFIELSGSINRNSYNFGITPHIVYELSRYTNLYSQLTGRISNTQGSKIVIDNLSGLYDFTQSYNYNDNSKMIIPEVSLIRTKKQTKLTTGIKFQISSQFYNNNNREINKHNNYYSLLPMLQYSKNALLNTSMSELTFTYSSKVTTPGSNMLTPSINNSNGSFLVVGNPNLRQSYSHSFSSKLSLMENEIAVNASISGSYITNPISLNGFLFFKKDTILEQYNYYLAKAGSYLSFYRNGQNRYYFLPRIDVSLPINFLGSLLSASFQYKYENIPVFIGNASIQSIQQNAAVSLGLNSNFSKYFDFKINSISSYSFNRRSSGIRDHFFSEQLIISLNAFLFSENLNLSIYSNTFLSQNPYYRNNDQTINLLNFSLNYKFLKERNACLGIFVNDLLKSRNIFNIVSAPQSQTSTWSNVTGTQVMFNFSYKFNYKKSEGKKTIDSSHKNKNFDNDL